MAVLSELGKLFFQRTAKTPRAPRKEIRNKTINANLFFNPEKCRNETEVESKLIVHYLLPKLGYPPHTWHQEVTFNRMRMDFLVIASGIVNRKSTVMLVLEAKHPRQKLDKHIRKFKRYLTSLNARYGLLTNGKLVQVYEQINNELSLII